MDHLRENLNANLKKYLTNILINNLIYNLVHAMASVMESEMADVKNGTLILDNIEYTSCTNEYRLTTNWKALRRYN